MQHALSNIMKLSLVSVFIILGINLTSCSSSEYIYVKVKKSDLIPDSYELNRDSLIVGGLKICNMAERFYYKSISMGGGGLSFTGFTIPAHLAKTEYGGYTHGVWCVCTTKPARAFSKATWLENYVWVLPKTSPHQVSLKFSPIFRVIFLISP